MPEYHEVVHTRGQQTIGVWGTFDEDLKVGKLTLAQHTTDVAAIFTAAGQRDAAQDDLDLARAAVRNKTAELADLTIRFPRAAEGQLEPDSDLHGEIENCRAIEPNTPENAVARGRRVIGVVTRYNAGQAALAPPGDPLTIKNAVPGGDDVELADLQALVNAMPGLEQAVEDAKSALNKKRSALRKATAKVDKNNKRWFDAWSGNFAAGSDELEALSQIDTGPHTPPPSALQISTVTPSAGGHFAVAYTSGGGAHATTLHLQWKIVGVDAEFGHDTLVILAGQTVATGALTGTDVTFRTRAQNSQGTTYSGEKTDTAL